MTSEEIAERTASAIDLHNRIAVQLGRMTLECDGCGVRRTLNAQQIALCLKNGWPTHCKQTAFVCAP